VTERTQDTAGVIAPPPLIYLAALGLGFLAEWLLPGGDLPAAFTWVGFALIALGIGIDIWFSVTLSRARTPVNPYSPTEALVTSGPYRFSRNPAYVGMAVIFVGIALAADAPWALLALPLALVTVDRGVIRREEPYLERLFGEQYRRYSSQTRRWV
jgi:protein-S-isoprenylcysteine O-methyltransferase Ste14